ncbi:MAG: hypothetical protein KDJ82_10520 [Rhodobacteraceae bacterium]|jgi:hypothetical protein|nr:hypothetical protein [Paracoccaceae bacterium]
MKLVKAILHPMWSCEDGAVTVDWVVLTASIVALGMIVGAVIWSASEETTNDIASFVGSQKVLSTF